MNNFAGFLSRLGAYFIDKLLFGVYLLFLLFLILYLFGDNFILVEKGIIWLVFYFVFCHYFVWNLYLVLFTHFFGGSLGKLVLGLKVTDEAGANLSFGKAALRFFVGYVISSLLFNLGFLYIIWDKKKQGFHDKITGSYVLGLGGKVLFRFLAVSLVLILMGGVLAGQSRRIIVEKSVLVQIVWQVENHKKRFEKFFSELEKLERKKLPGGSFKFEQKLNIEKKQEFEL